MAKLFYTTLLIVAGLTQTGLAQNFDQTKLDNYFNALEINNKFMGSVAVSQNGAIIYAKTIGFSNLENKTKANENTKYRIGSISKTFTAVLILKAVEDRKLDLNQTIEGYFPTIKNAKSLNFRRFNQKKSLNPCYTIYAYEDINIVPVLIFLLQNYFFM